MTSLKTILTITLLFWAGFFEKGYSQTPAQNQLPANVDKMTDKQLETFLKAAEAKGLSESQIETLALSKGYTSEDIAKVRERINRLKTGTAEVKPVGEPGSETKNDNATREQIGEVAERTDTQASDETKVGNKTEIFGSQLFNNKNLTFEPNLKLPTPKNYVLGPDDALRIDITGYAYQHYETTVSPEGTIRIENLAPIYVNGSTVDQAKVKIVDRLKGIFAGLRNGSLNADVTLGNVRTIKVTIIGEVQNPGTYSISSLASAFNALYLSGGPNKNGSFRNIQVLRNNAVIKKIDIYNFLLNGTREDDIILMDQDVILVPVFQKKIRIDGEVKKGGIFELKEGDNFKTLLEYAGGYTEQAYTATVNVKRNTPSEKKILTFDPQVNPDFITQNGDQFVVGAIIERFENKVEVRGAVFRPGEFALGENIKTVKQLIQNAQGLREDAYLERVFLIRKKNDLDVEYIAIDLRKLLKGEISDIELKREDQLLVKSIVEIRQQRLIYIEGAVNNPGFYDFADNMEVKDLVILAGGFTDGASMKRVEIARRLHNDESNNKSTEIITIDLSSQIASNQETPKLKAFDNIFIRNLPNYDEQRVVQVIGEVNYPGSYAIENKNERITDIIIRSGGLRKEADINGAKLFRGTQLIFVDWGKVLKNKNSPSNLLIERGDRIEIPKKRQTVTIIGQVLNPTTVAYQPDFSFRGYIAQAGGFTDSAFVRKTYVKYANGSTDRTRSFLGMKSYPKVRSGMTVIVPKRNRVQMSTAEKIALSTSFASLSAIILTIIRLL